MEGLKFNPSIPFNPLLEQQGDFLLEPPEGFDEFLKATSKLSEIYAGIESKRQEIIHDLVSAKGTPRPEKLYHYTNTDSVIGIIQSNNLWATGFKSLNDATELVHGADLLGNELYRYGEQHGGDILVLLNNLSNYYRDHGETYREFFETYIISFSEDTDVLSQWRAYSDQAKGCCVEFDFTDSRLFTIVSEDTPWALEVLPVIYDETLQRTLIQSGIKRLLDYLDSTEWTVQKVVNASETEQSVILGLLIHTFEPFVTAFKHTGFSEEKEWRGITSCASDLTEKKKKERDTDSGTSSYLECMFIQGDEENLWQRELLPITAIKYGPLAEELARKVIEIQLELSNYNNQVKHSKSEIPLK